MYITRDNIRYELSESELLQAYISRAKSESCVHVVRNGKEFVLSDGERLHAAVQAIQNFLRSDGRVRTQALLTQKGVSSLPSLWSQASFVHLLDAVVENLRSGMTEEEAWNLACDVEG